MTETTITTPLSRRRAGGDVQVLSPVGGRTRKRLDLQGLRAFAVGLVILNHAFGWPAGGFVGVDIFFVISGFLMTSLLYREYERSGTIRLFAFYRRRIRRLIPASAAVIVATVAASFAVFAPGRAMNALWDGVASLLFVSNWRFAAASTDYFAQGAATSPLQHYWSLSLEEQYYLVWPLAILVIAIVAARERVPRVMAALTTLGITVLLFGLSLYLTHIDVASAYFVTPARLWELSIGSTVALCMPLFQRIPSALRPVIMVISLAGMLVACVITPTGVGFPAPWAAIAVMSAAVFIAVPWQPVSRPWLNPFGNRLMGFLGDISYSLYLWHFPALILITELFRGFPGDKTPLPAAISIGVTVIVAALSYRFIEEPVRRSQWLEPTKRRSRARKLDVFAVGGAVMAAVIAVVVTIAVDSGPRSTGTSLEAASTAAPSDAPGHDGKTVLKEIATSIRAGLAAKEWPAELTPSMDTVLNGYSHEEQAHLCGAADYPGVDKCTWGSPDAPISVVMVGDSTSIAYTPMMRSLVDASHGRLRVTTFAMYSCLFADVLRESPDPAVGQRCTDRNDMAIEEIARLKPTYVFVTNVPSPLKIEGGRELTMPVYEQALDRYLERMAPNTDKIVFLSTTPNEKNLRTCYSPRVSPTECVSHTQPIWKSISLAEKKAAAKVDGVFVDTRQVYCSGDSCPTFADGIIIRFDSTHITDEWGIHVAPGIVVLLDNAGVHLGEQPSETTGDAPVDGSG